MTIVTFYSVICVSLSCVLCVFKIIVLLPFNGEIIYISFNGVHSWRRLRLLDTLRRERECIGGDARSVRRRRYAEKHRTSDKLSRQCLLSLHVSSRLNDFLDRTQQHGLQQRTAHHISSPKCTAALLYRVRRRQTITLFRLITWLLGHAVPAQFPRFSRQLFTNTNHQWHRRLWTIKWALLWTFMRLDGVSRWTTRQRWPTNVVGGPPCIGPYNGIISVATDS